MRILTLLYSPSLILHMEMWSISLWLPDLKEGQMLCYTVCLIGLQGLKTQVTGKKSFRNSFFRDCWVKYSSIVLHLCTKLPLSVCLLVWHAYTQAVQAQQCAILGTALEQLVSKMRIWAMAMMEHSGHWCNRLGKLAESQHMSNMTQPQTERGG